MFQAKSLIVLLVAGYVLLWSAGTAEAVEPAAPTAQAAAVAETGTTPYVAVVTANKVNVRSGPSAAYYVSTLVNKGDRVIVRDETDGWAKIDPTPGAFCYIYKKYIQLRDYDQTIEPIAGAELGKQETFRVVTDAPIGQEVVYGLVTADRVRVRAGSTTRAPISANQIQGFKNTGDTVAIIGSRDDYYQIACPADARFWLSKEFLERQGPLTAELAEELGAQASMAVLVGDQAEDGLTGEKVVQYKQDHDAYRALVKQLESQGDVPLAEQELAPIRTQLEQLLAETQFESIKARLGVLERQLARLELAQQVWRDTQQQDQRLADTLEKIDQRLQATVAEQTAAASAEDDLVVKGRLARSAVFTAEKGNPRFLVLNEDEEITYYAVSAEPRLDLGLYVGRQVSLVGQARYDSYSGIRVLYVTSVVEYPAETP